MLCDVVIVEKEVVIVEVMIIVEVEVEVVACVHSRGRSYVRCHSGGGGYSRAGGGHSRGGYRGCGLM